MKTKQKPGIYWLIDCIQMHRLTNTQVHGAIDKLSDVVLLFAGVHVNRVDCLEKML